MAINSATAGVTMVESVGQWSDLGFGMTGFFFDCVSRR
jgi:hypothetical protein